MLGRRVAAAGAASRRSQRVVVRRVELSEACPFVGVARRGFFGGPSAEEVEQQRAQLAAQQKQLEAVKRQVAVLATSAPKKDEAESSSEALSSMREALDAVAAQLTAEVEQVAGSVAAVSERLASTSAATALEINDLHAIARRLDEINDSGAAAAAAAAAAARGVVVGGGEEAVKKNNSHEQLVEARLAALEGANTVSKEEFEERARAVEEELKRQGEAVVARPGSSNGGLEDEVRGRIERLDRLAAKPLIDRPALEEALKATAEAVERRAVAALDAFRTNLLDNARETIAGAVAEATDRLRREVEAQARRVQILDDASASAASTTDLSLLKSHLEKQVDALSFEATANANATAKDLGAKLQAVDTALTARLEENHRRLVDRLDRLELASARTEATERTSDLLHRRVAALEAKLRLRFEEEAKEAAAAANKARQADDDDHLWEETTTTLPFDDDATPTERTHLETAPGKAAPGKTATTNPTPPPDEKNPSFPEEEETAPLDVVPSYSTLLKNVLIDTVVDRGLAQRPAARKKTKVDLVSLLKEADQKTKTKNVVVGHN